jgi:hypothetical protein
VQLKASGALGLPLTEPGVPRLCRNVAYNQRSYSGFCCSSCAFTNGLEHDDDCRSNALEPPAPPAVPQRSFFARFSGALAAAVGSSTMVAVGAPPYADPEGIGHGGSVDGTTTPATDSNSAAGTRPHTL